MPINLKIDRSNNLTTFVVYDQITADDVLETLKTVYEDPEKPPTLNALWDFREGSPDPQIKDEDIERIVSYLSNHAGKRAGGKTAIVARTDLDFEITKKYEFFTQLKGLSVTVEVFRSLGEAMIWLNRHSL